MPHAAGSGGSGFGVSTSTRESAGRKAADTEAAEAFLSWAHSAGIQFPKLKVANFDGELHLLLDYQLRGQIGSSSQCALL